MKRALALLLILAALPAQAMETVLSMRAQSMQFSAVTRYSKFMGNAVAQTSLLYGYSHFSAAGELSAFSFRVATAPGAGLSTTYSIIKNGSTEFSFAISGTATTATPSNTVTVAAGDWIYIQAVNDTGVATSDVYATCLFTGTVAGESVIFGGSGSSTTSTTAVRYGALMGTAAFGVVDGDARQCFPTAGTVSHLYLSGNTALGSGNYDVTMSVNGTPSALTVTVDNSGLYFSDVTHSVAISAGDVVQLVVTPNSPDGTKRFQWGVKWTPTVDGEAVILGGASNDLSATASEFNYLNNNFGTWSTTEANLVIDWPAVELKYLTIQLENSPGASPNSYAFTVRDDGAGTALDVTILDPRHLRAGHDSQRYASRRVADLSRRDPE